MGLATPPCRKTCATKTHKTTEETDNLVLEEEGSSLQRLMTLSGESRKETTKPTSLLKNRRITIGTWNVRIMYEAGKMAEVAAEMRR